MPSDRTPSGRPSCSKPAEGNAQPSPADIEDFLAWTLVRVGHGVEQVLTSSIASHGLTPRQFGVLALLSAHDNLTQSDLARAVLVRVQSIGPLVASLTRRGLITRRGTGGRGRRSSFDLTEAGRDLLDQAWTRVTASNSPAHLGLDEKQAQALARLLQDVLGEIGSPGSVHSSD